MSNLKKEISTGILIKQINNIYEKDFNQLLKSIGITASQCAVLDFLFYTELEKVNQKDIEKALSLQNPTVTGLLKRLDEKGYILAMPSNTDKRCNNIFLTEKAYDVRRVIEKRRTLMDKSLMLGMTTKEKETFLKILKKVLYNIS
ncbi:MAG TPA: MarR family transcriptional regulator [Candidatus Dorea intestinavium]|nr:MarR family transcriptional regulator [Candidatus Dorea intestinavium]